MWCIWDPGCNKFPVSSLPDLALHHCSSLLPEAPHPLGVLVTRSFHPIQFCILYYAAVFCFPRNFTFQGRGVSGSGLNNDKMVIFCLKLFNGFPSGTLQMKSTIWSWCIGPLCSDLHRSNICLPCSSFLHDVPKALASLLYPNRQSMVSMCILYM